MVLTPEAAAVRSLLAAHECILSSVFSCPAFDVTTFEIAHAVRKGACVKFTVRLERTDWDRICIVIDRTEGLISLHMIRTKG